MKPIHLTAILLAMLLVGTVRGQRQDAKQALQNQAKKTTATPATQKAVPKKGKPTGDKAKPKSPQKQKAGKKKKPSRKPPEADPNLSQLDIMNARFLRRKPLVGKSLPAAKGFDEKGKPFNLKKTRGSYTVLVFGCLT